MPNSSTAAVKPPEGKTTVDEMLFEPERLSYVSADRIGEQIAGRVRSAVGGDRVIVIAGTQLLADLANLQSAYLALDSLLRDYDTVSTLGGELAVRRSLVKAEELKSFEAEHAAAKASLAAAVPAMAGAVGAVLESALGLVSFFREDVEYRGAKTTVDPLAFEIALASRLKAGGVKTVYVPDLMIIPLAEAKPGWLRDRLERVLQAKARAWKLIAPVVADLARAESEMDEAARRGAAGEVERLSARVTELRRVMQPASDAVSRADQRLADLQNQWGQVEASSGVSTLARLLRAENIRALTPLYLHAKVVSSGGHHRVSRNLFRMLFMGDGLSFSGGATVRWALLDENGSVSDGGIITRRRGTWFQPLTDDLT